MSASQIKTMHTRRRAERALLGSVLSDQQVASSIVLDELRPSDFTLEGYRAIWAAVRALRGAGAAINIHAVQAEMERDGATDAIVLDMGGTQAPDLRAALVELVGFAQPQSALADAAALRGMADNLQLAEELEGLTLTAKAWPPIARQFLCNALEGLAELFCQPAAEAR